uniref:MIP26177p1 n=1 Tax=Drosophila melanogaster TaxID=7227 RepID=M9Z4Q3_DROME|nr:MIP26177p1 [Drosophila melanogaster]
MPEKTTHNAPAWLTEEYVEKKLRVYFKNDTLNLKKLTIKPATANGENYASVMTRISVEYITKDSKDNQSATFLLKTTFADKDPAAHLLINYGIYTREIDMYEQILPRLADIVKNELHDSRKLFAATVGVDRERDSIMFEDLSLERYKVACRLKKLDLEHTYLVLEKLADFHAAGAALAQRQPGIFEKNYDRGFFNKHVRGYEPIMKNILKALSRTLDLSPDLKERYQAKIDRLIDNVMDYGERSTSVAPGDFVTLAHGDIWTTNVMFQYDDEGHPVNAIFIDFQFSVWNSPAIDLQYFFSTSIHENLRLERQTELVQFYFYKLVVALERVKYSGKVPSLFEFQQQFRTKGFYAVFASLIFEPTMVYNGKEEPSIEQFMTSDEKGVRLRDAVYQTEENLKKLHLTLPFLDQLGLLDEM